MLVISSVVRVTRATSEPRLPLTQRLTALFALALFVWLNLLAVSPQLHEFIHGHDAATTQHQCAATLLSKGQVTPADPVVVVEAPTVSSLSVVPAQTPVWVSPDCRLAPSRAPPLSA